MTTIPILCADCGQRPVPPDRHYHCEYCIAAHVAHLRRLRERGWSWAGVAA